MSRLYPELTREQREYLKKRLNEVQRRLVGLPLQEFDPVASQRRSYFAGRPKR